jgi:protein gp37
MSAPIVFVGNGAQRMITGFGKFKVHPFADEFPLLEGDELARLVADIKANGLMQAITLAADNETIVDGRNRYLACNEARVDPRFDTLPQTFTEEQIIAYIWSANGERRHLTAGQRAFLALKIEELLAEEAKQRQRLGGELKGKLEENFPQARIPRRAQARDSAGKQASVSGKAVQQAKAVAKSPDLAKDVKSGKTTLNRAYRQAKKREEATQRNRPEAEQKPATPAKNIITLVTHKGEAVEYPLPKSKPTFNPANQHISWAAWTWNPVTGCLHGCPYCYAREIAERKDDSTRTYFPVGFIPLFHRERLEAPGNTKLPDDIDANPRNGRVFVCSMADLYGQWVPDTWIEQIHDVCSRNRQWEYLLLTKFPERYNRVRSLPPTAWVGTSVDEQKRVRIAENAFRNIGNVAVKWLSLEPLREELRFTDLSMFDWVVIGAQTATQQPGDGRVPEFAPPFEWVARIVAQAREAGCKVWLKPNLLGDVHDQSPGMQLPQEVPETHCALRPERLLV